MSKTRMLSIECFSRKGVNPFVSHLQDKKWSDHCADKVVNPKLCPMQKLKSPAVQGFSESGEVALNHCARVLVIRIADHFVGVMLDEVFTANAQPHGNSRRHEHR